MRLGQPALMQSLLASAGFTDIEVRAMAALMRLSAAQDDLDFVNTAGLPS